MALFPPREKGRGSIEEWGECTRGTKESGEERKGKSPLDEWTGPVDVWKDHGSIR
jgi:hypothetical protein